MASGLGWRAGPVKHPRSRRGLRLNGAAPAFYYDGMITRLATIALAFALLFGPPAWAADDEVPYWATINTEELNMRVGPSLEYKIAWVYRRDGLPLKVLRVVGGWRLVEDHMGDRGWVTANLLARTRGAVVIGDGLAPMRDAPGANGRLKWNAEPGVVGLLGECEAAWCRFDVGGRVGWIAAARLWGAGKP